MSQGLFADSSRLAEALLDVAPKFFRYLRTELPPDAELTEADPVLREISEVRATIGQLALLRILFEHERCMMQELADHLAVAPSTVTAMVKRLLALGYVERLRDDEDWRAVWVKPTERGRRAVAAYDQVRLLALQRRLERLSETERTTLAEAIPVLLHLIEM